MLNVEVTNECDLECPMCARTTSMTRPVQHMAEPVFRRLIDQADELQVKKLWLHMFGESLLHPRIYDFIAYAARKPRIGLVGLSTNVTTLTAKNSHRLIDARLGHLVLSVDALSKDVYKVVRGGNFDRILRNTRGFLEAHRERDSPMTVNVQIIAMGIKREELDGFTREWAPFKNDRVKINVKTLTNFGGLVDLAQFAGDDRDDGVPAASRGRKSCPQLWDSLTVQSSGEIVACCYDVNGTMSYGNSAAITLGDAWRGESIRFETCGSNMPNWRLTGCRSAAPAKRPSESRRLRSPRLTRISHDRPPWGSRQVDARALAHFSSPW